MESKITQALARQFEKHRIIFWYDSERELRDEYEALQLDGVEKVELQNNEFGVKYRILRQQPQQKFLLYHEGPPPVERDNWLLDVLLAHGEFRTGQVSIWLGQLELGPEYADVVEAHKEFFRSNKRLEALRPLVDPKDSFDMLRIRLLAVCTNAEPRLDTVLESLLADYADGRDEAEKLIARCRLDAFLWKRVREDYGYPSDAPGVKDFAIELFKSCYGMGVGGDVRLRPEALVFFKRWKDSRRNSDAFATLSERMAGLLRVSDDLEGRDYRALGGLDYFELIDRRVLYGLVQEIAKGTLTARECEDIIQKRRAGYWYGAYANVYEAVSHGAALLAELGALDLSMNSLTDGVERYSRTWFRIDQRYRNFISYSRRSNQPQLLQALAQRVEKHYTNNYLVELNDRWQKFVDQAEQWRIPGILRQTDFFADRVQPFLDRGNKIYVIISDALRYEVADELAALIRKEDRYEADVEPAVSALPSYTQLGMAALLPHRELSIRAEKGAGVVFVDGIDSRGTDNRNKILNQALNGRGVAIQAEDFRSMNKDDRRAFVRDYDVVYVYHNTIDAVGDKRDREERVFEAASDTLEEVMALVKMLANANASNIFVTADHGFIYQNEQLDESDFLGVEPTGKTILNTDRRFVIGQDLQPHTSFKHFTAGQAGLNGDVEMLLPKSINRLRKSGSGSRYVHGGAALQEIVIPVVRINKKRTSDVRTVEVSIIRGASQVITSGQLSVRLYQKEAVSEKVQPRTLRIGLYTKDGKLISDSHETVFALTSENEREREVTVRLILSKDADTANQQTVYLRLMQREEGTSHEIEYDRVEYVLRRSFTSDFDF